MRFTQMPIAIDGGRHLDASLFQPDTEKSIKPKKLVVLMHGWGADGQDLLPLAPMLAGNSSGLAIICQTRQISVLPIHLAGNGLNSLALFIV